MREVFEHNGKAFIYDPDDPGCGTTRFLKAQSIWVFGQEIAKAPPETWQVFEASGASDTDFRAFCHILMECDEEGNILPYDPATSPKRVGEFLNVLPSSNVPRLKNCQADFFGRAELLDVESLMQLGALLNDSSKGEAAGRLLRWAMSRATDDEERSPSESDTSDSSTSLESSTDDSPPETPTPPTTGGDTLSSSEDTEPGT